MRPLRVLLFLTLSLVTSLAWSLDEEDPLLARGTLDPAEWGVGQAGQLTLKMSLPRSFHAYEDKFKLTVLEPDGFIVGQWKIDRVKDFYDKFTKKNRRAVSGESILTVPLEAPSRFIKDAKVMKIELVYQACSDAYCLFPTTKTVEVPIRLIGAPISSNADLVPADGMPAAEHSPNPSWFSADSLNRLLSDNKFLALLLVFLAGVVTSFTPCIFPMIPITLAVLGNHAERRTRLQNFLLSLFYVHGIATTYSVLGLVAASSGSVFGASLGNPWIVSGICALFLTMSLSMYGLFDIQVPAFLRNRLGSQKTAPGYGGAYLSGLIAGIVASPCVGPVLVTILAWVATTQSLFYGFVLLFTYAMGLGLIFLVLGAFTELTRRLPRSGPWLEATKFVLGSFMLGAFYYYLGLIIPDRWHDVLLGIGLLTLGSLGGAFSSMKGATALKKIRKGVTQGLLVLGFGYLALGVFNLRPLLQQRMISEGGAATALTTQWRPYSEEALAKAAEENKPVLVDFWAEWCAACHELEQITFVDLRVRSVMEQFVLLRFDATQDTPELRRLKAKWKIQGLPTVLLLNPRGVWLNELTLTEFERPERFLKRIEKALN